MSRITSANVQQQTRVSQAKSAAEEFPPGPQRDMFIRAADQLRLPYWDWAMTPPSGQNVVPEVLSQGVIQVLTPNGTQTIDNPLASYQFHPIDPGLYYLPVSSILVEQFCRFMSSCPQDRCR